MKRLMLALVLVVVLTLTIAAPAFAGPPEDKQGPGNMPDGAGDALTDIVTKSAPGMFLRHMWVAFAAVNWGNNSQGCYHSYWHVGSGLYQVYWVLTGQEWE
jgi:hypothetical protein